MAAESTGETDEGSDEVDGAEHARPDDGPGTTEGTAPESADSSADENKSVPGAKAKSVPPAAKKKAAAVKKAEAAPVSRRYTAPVPTAKRGPSPRWVPVLMFAFWGVGLLLIILNYMGVLPGSDNGGNGWYLVAGLGSILAGIITATQYR